MNKRLLIWIVVYLSCSVFVQAQWTAKDSLWLQNMLSGKDSIRLNPETMRAIQGGTFLHPETPSTPMLINPSKLPILKDFSNYIQEEEDTVRKVAMKDLPPGVFWRHQLKESPADRRNQISPGFFKVYYTDWLNTVPMDHMGRMQTSGQGTADFAHTLNYMFSSEYRQHYKNKLRAEVSLKEYKEAPSEEMVKRMKKFREQQRELPLPLVTNPVSTKGDTSKRDIAKRDTVKRDSTKVRQPATSQSSSVPDSLSVATPVDSLGYKMHPN